MNERHLIALLAARLPRISVRAGRLDGDTEVLELPAASLVPVGRFLRSDADAAYDLVDITAIDRWSTTANQPRFLVVVLLCSRTHRSRARLEIEVDILVKALPPSDAAIDLVIQQVLDRATGTVASVDSMPVVQR